jgi:TonB-linked SusC/RagA family outer membrane protein
MVIPLALLTASAVPVRAQEGAIAGTVVNAQTLEPVRAAQVFIPRAELGTRADLGTLTNRDGQYRLAPVPAGEVSVEVRLIGFRSAAQTVTVVSGEVTTLDFELEVSAIQLEDVTVNIITGRERRRRQDGTNAGRIDVDAISKAPIQDFTDLMAGRTEGVILQDVSGTTGTSPRIRIRGMSSLSLSSDPLIIVDGIYFSNDQGINEFLFTGGQDPSRLNDLNPDEIEGIEIVKGPAASALYGAVGANGVILVTTKRGTPGGTDWHFFTERGQLEDRTDWPLNYEAVQIIGDSNNPVFTEDGFNTTDYAACANFQAGAGDCTQDRFLTFNTLRDPRTTAFQKGNRQSYGMNVAGGTPSSTYYISGEYERERGVVTDPVINREEHWSLRTNLDAGLADNLNASISIGFMSRDVEFNDNDNDIFGSIINGLGGMAGFVPGDDPNGGPNKLNYAFFRNMQDLAEAAGATQEIDRFTGSINASWRPLEWLSAQGTFGIDLVSGFEHNTVQPGLDNLSEPWTLGLRAAARNQRQNWTGNFSVTGTAAIPGTSITSTTTAGASYQEELWEGTSCWGMGLVEGTDSCSSTTSVFDLAEDWLNVVTVGAFFQQEFSLADKLFLTGSVRLDDNSNFGGNAPLEAYPSANVSYLMSDEEWFPKGGVLSELRLRAAYGVAGLRPGFRDAITLFAPVTVRIDGEELPAVTLDETGNELLEPERSTEWEGGIDLGLFEDRVGIEFTYFHKTSKDALISRELAPSLGLTHFVFDNLAEVRNKGTEMSLRALAIDHRNVRANVAIQWTTLDNLIVELGEGVEPIIGGVQRHDEGYAAAAYWHKPISWDDANGDGLLSIDEVAAGDEDLFIDEAFPTWTASFNADLELFQAIRISTLFDARGGHSQSNGTERIRCRLFAQPGRGCEATGGDNATLEDQAAFVADRFHGARSGYVQKAGFIKWREISFTLTAPPSLAQKHALLERTSLTFSGRNLQTFTDYPGIDPEIHTGGSDSIFGQGEFFTQPPVRVFTVRLDVRF